MYFLQISLAKYNSSTFCLYCLLVVVRLRFSILFLVHITVIGVKIVNRLMHTMMIGQEL